MLELTLCVFVLLFNSTEKRYLFLRSVVEVAVEKWLLCAVILVFHLQSVCMARFAA